MARISTITFDQCAAANELKVAYKECSDYELTNKLSGLMWIKDKMARLTSSWSDEKAEQEEEQEAKKLWEEIGGRKGWL